MAANYRAPLQQMEASRSDAATAVYLYKHMEDPEVKPWETPNFTPMTKEKKRELRMNQARAYLLRGQAEMRLCDYWAALRTFQLGCKAWPKDKELREHWCTENLPPLAPPPPAHTTSATTTSRPFATCAGSPPRICSAPSAARRSSSWAGRKLVRRRSRSSGRRQSVHSLCFSLFLSLTPALWNFAPLLTPLSSPLFPPSSLPIPPLLSVLLSVSGSLPL